MAKKVNGEKPVEASAQAVAVILPDTTADEVNVDRVMLELARVGFCDITELLEYENFQGVPAGQESPVSMVRLRCRDPKKLPEDLRRSIMHMRIVRRADGADEFVVRLFPKVEALKALAVLLAEGVPPPNPDNFGNHAVNSGQQRKPVAKLTGLTLLGPTRLKAEIAKATRKGDKMEKT